MIGHTNRTHPMSCKSPMHVLGEDPLLSMIQCFWLYNTCFSPSLFVAFPDRTFAISIKVVAAALCF